MNVNDALLQISIRMVDCQLRIEAFGLIGMLDKHPVEEALTPDIFAALVTLDSDYEHRRVLQAALQRGAPSRRGVVCPLRMADY